MPAHKPTILITGKSGQLGKSLREAATGYKQFHFLFTEKEVLDISNTAQVKKYFQDHQPSICINTAAYTAVDLAESDRDKAFDVNAHAVGELAMICKDNQCGFLHLSTDYVFNGLQHTPYKETDETNPVNYYGFTKRSGEEMALKNYKQTFIIRTSWLYSEFGFNFLKTMLRLFKTKPEIAVVNDQRGAPTYAWDLANVLLIMASQILTGAVPARPGIYHFSNKGNITWYDFAIAIREIAGANCKIRKITTKEYPTPAMRPAYSVFDTQKIQETFGIKINDWKDSLKVCMENLPDEVFPVSMK